MLFVLLLCSEQIIFQRLEKNLKNPFKRNKSILLYPNLVYHCIIQTIFPHANN